MYKLYIEMVSKKVVRTKSKKASTALATKKYVKKVIRTNIENKQVNGSLYAEHISVGADFAVELCHPASGTNNYERISDCNHWKSDMECHVARIMRPLFVGSLFFIGWIQQMNLR